MSSKVLTTQITRVEEVSDVEQCDNEVTVTEKDVVVDNKISAINTSFKAQFSDSESDTDIQDNRYETIADDNDFPEEALQKIKELNLKNNFNCFDIIQKKNDNKDVSPQMVCHSVLSDQKADKVMDKVIIDKEFKYVFKSKTKLLKQLELKAKQKSDKKIEKNKKSLKTDVQINSIPKTFEEFLRIVFDLKADLIEDEKSKLFFREETHNRDIRFQSHDSYVNSFIPFVMRELWSALKTSIKPNAVSFQTTYLKSDSPNEVILSHIRDKSFTQSSFRFGQMVSIKYSVKQSPESDESQVESRFGFVLEVKTKLIDKTSDQLTHPLILSQTETQTEENDFILETICIYCNPLEKDLESVSVLPLICVQKYLLEARIVSELKDSKHEKIFKQILKPNFKFGISGLSVNLNHRKDLFDIQKDCIQKAYEICCLPEMEDFSSFLAVYGGPKTGKTEALIETAVQLLKFADEKVNKLIVITNEINGFTELIDTLKKNDIKVFHINGSDKCLSHKNYDFKRLIRKMNKQNLFDDIIGKNESIDRCLKFYGEELQSTDLSVRDHYVKELIERKIVHKLIAESEVIIGSIGCLMNDETFNAIFNKNVNNNISCALIDNAHVLTETELLTLLYAGVRSFALFGDRTKKAVSFEKSESFFNRYIGIYTKNYIQNDPKNYSVLYLRDTIESLKRLANIKKNQGNNQNNYQRTLHPNQRIAQYRSHSNYGSEYFKRFENRDQKPFKPESDYKPKGAEYNFFDRYSNTESNVGSSGPPPGFNQSTRGRPPNPMINGIGSHMAYGGRNSYLENNDRNDSFSASYGMSSTSTDPNANNFLRNGNQFVSNPTRHENYNLF